MLPGFDRLDGRQPMWLLQGPFLPTPLPRGSLLQQKVWSHEDLPSGLGVGGGDECDTDLPSWDFSVGQVTGTVYARSRICTYENGVLLSWEHCRGNQEHFLEEEASVLIFVPVCH